MSQFHSHTRFALVAAALLALGVPPAVAQDTTVGTFTGPSTPPSAPVTAGVSTGPYTGSYTGNYVAGAVIGNDSAPAVGVGSSNNGQTSIVGAQARGLPSTTPATSQLPHTCLSYPGVDVSANCPF